MVLAPLSGVKDQYLNPWKDIFLEPTISPIAYAELLEMVKKLIFGKISGNMPLYYTFPRLYLLSIFNDCLISDSLVYVVLIP